VSDKDREALLEKNFTPEQRVCLDYVAERAAVKAGAETNDWSIVLFK
jgi:hypothetical protein